MVRRCPAENSAPSVLRGSLCRAPLVVSGVRIHRGKALRPGRRNLTARLRGPNGGIVMISGREDDFKVWMRERAPRFEATGPVLATVDPYHHCHGRQRRRPLRAGRAGGRCRAQLTEGPTVGGAELRRPDPEGHQWEFATPTNSSSSM